MNIVEEIMNVLFIMKIVGKVKEEIWVILGEERFRWREKMIGM